jgi:hypothetical protein
MIREYRHITQRPEYFRLNPDSDLADGLVFAGLGRFPGSTDYDDATESLFGGGNRGTLTSMDPATDWVFDDELGRWCLYFGGSNQKRVNIPGSAKSQPWSGDCTISTWIYPHASGINRSIIENGNSVRVRWIYIAMGSDDKIKFSFDDATTRETWSTSNTIPNEEWSHIAVTKNSSGFVSYINGSPDGAGEARGNCADNSQPTSIGGGSYGGSEWWGEMLDVLFYSRVLTPAEIGILAYRSDPMLGGLIQPTKRVLCPVSSGAAPATNAMPMAIHHYTMAGGL